MRVRSNAGRVCAQCCAKLDPPKISSKKREKWRFEKVTWYIGCSEATISTEFVTSEFSPRLRKDLWIKINYFQVCYIYLFVHGKTIVLLLYYCIISIILIINWIILYYCIVSIFFYLRFKFLILFREIWIFVVRWKLYWLYIIIIAFF